MLLVVFAGRASDATGGIWDKGAKSAYCRKRPILTLVIGWDAPGILLVRQGACTKWHPWASSSVTEAIRCSREFSPILGRSTMQGTPWYLQHNQYQGFRFQTPVFLNILCILFTQCNTYNSVTGNCNSSPFISDFSAPNYPGTSKTKYAAKLQ